MKSIIMCPCENREKNHLSQNRENNNREMF